MKRILLLTFLWPLLLLASSPEAPATVTITLSSLTLSFSGATLPAAAAASHYSQSVAGYAAGGVPAYTFSYVSKTGTNTWSVNAAGVISGTPMTAETDTVTAQVTDSLSHTANATFTIIVSVESQAATPTYSPAGGTYTIAQNVSISDASPSTTIYYTTDGSTPTTSSAVYSSPISVASPSVTLKAIATSAGLSTSAVQSEHYTINALTITTAQPLNNATQETVYTTGSPLQTMAATGGTPSYSWTLNSQSGGSNVWYLSSSGAIYGTPTTVETDTLNISVVDSASPTPTTVGPKPFPLSVIGIGVAPTPTFAPGTEYVLGSTTVVISDTLNPATIYYCTTTTSCTPTTASTSCAAPCTITVNPALGSPETVNAIATASGYLTSSVGSATYTAQPLTITTTSLPGAVVGDPYNFTMQAIGGLGPPYTWAIVSGAPLWLSINSSTGALSGMPTATGTFSVVISVTD